MKALSLVAPLILLFIVFGMILAVLQSTPAVEAAAASAGTEISVDETSAADTAAAALAVPLSGASSLGTAGAEVMQSAPAPEALEAYPGLGQFAASTINGNAGDVVGVYVRDIMALPVQQQPPGDPSYVASQHNLLTEFAMPKRYGAVGILAHNYLSGSRFSQLTPGTEIVVVFGDGRIARYTVTGSESYQALDPNSPVSDFVHPNDPTRRVLTSSEMFQRIYTQPNQIVFQTCVEAFGDPSWGRIFITAEAAGPIELSIPPLSMPGLN